MHPVTIGRSDRRLAALESLALGLWIGAALGFAFVFAPAAFHLIPQIHVFATLTAAVLARLSLCGVCLGGVAALAALLRMREHRDPRSEIARVVLILIASGCALYQQRAIVPAMLAIGDVRSAAYHALHHTSTTVCGMGLLALLAAFILAVVRAPE